MGPLLKGKSIIWDQKNRALKGAHDLKNREQAMVQGRIQLEDSILLQMGPNWFLRIWTLGPHLKWPY
jgi:hypothetical protein